MALVPLVQQNNSCSWTDAHIILLINERRRLNFEFNYQQGRSHRNLWARIAITINQRFGSNFNENQCKSKFQNLVSDYHVSKNNIYRYIFVYFCTNN